MVGDRSHIVEITSILVTCVMPGCADGKTLVEGIDFGECCLTVR